MQDNAPQKLSRTAEKPTGPTTEELGDQEIDSVSRGAGARALRGGSAPEGG